jgi:hypothetical protein
MDDSHPRTSKRCKNEYRFNKRTNLCHRTLNTTPIASHTTRSYPRNGKRCKPTYRSNKSKKLCVYKLTRQSPVGYESYERLGKRCKKSYRHHKPSGFCVYTKKRKRRVLNRELPLPIERQEEIVQSPYDSELNSMDNSVLYSPESPMDNSVYSSESPIILEDDNSVLYSPDLPNLDVNRPEDNL